MAQSRPQRRSCDYCCAIIVSPAMEITVTICTDKGSIMISMISHFVFFFKGLDIMEVTEFLWSVPWEPVSEIFKILSAISL